ncbi:MAG TPA: nitroreductase family protein [Syntrophomonadaceae bacterium]|nr:nitroreductase family protein [Syntrophomonadaceae bacterium]
MKNRSYRRFHESHAMSREVLESLVNLTRLSASAANKQPLRFMLSWEKEKNQNLFPTLAWAGYLSDWDGPIEGERPSAYIIMLADSELSTKWTAFDAGIACQSILLGATDLGFGGCIIGSVQREVLRSLLAIPPQYEILLVIALGKPREIVEIEPLQNNQVEYWRDNDGVHHVPKRSLKDIILT